MIAGTTSDCKIKYINISNSMATIHCILYSSSPAKIQKAFKFYIRDKEDPYTLLEASPNIYWIDRLNNYNNDSLNIDVNQYLELDLKVDITKHNTSKIVDRKWIRECNIIMRCLDSSIEDYAWISEDLLLISKKFDVPELTNLSFDSGKDFSLSVKFDIKYESQQDFSYNNTNIYYTILIRSATTYRDLESIDIKAEEAKDNKVNIKFINTYSEPILIKILTKNSNNEVIDTKEFLYKPFIKHTNTFIKTSSGIKKVILLVARYNNKPAINYNNVFVNIPKSIPLSIIRYGKKLVFTNNNYNLFDYSKAVIKISSPEGYEDREYAIATTLKTYVYEMPAELLNKDLMMTVDVLSKKFKYSHSLHYRNALNTNISLCDNRLLCSNETLCNERDIKKSGGL